MTSALQEDIAASMAGMLKLGNDVLNSSNFNQGGSYDTETAHLTGESPQHFQTGDFHTFSRRR